MMVPNRGFGGCLRITETDRSVVTQASDVQVLSLWTSLVLCDGYCTSTIGRGSDCARFALEYAPSPVRD